jgi:hypothetical protein
MNPSFLYNPALFQRHLAAVSIPRIWSTCARITLQANGLLTRIKIDNKLPLFAPNLILTSTHWRDNAGFLDRMGSLGSNDLGM